MVHIDRGNYNQSFLAKLIFTFGQEQQIDLHMGPFKIYITGFILF
jgi:hypothetical protein